MCFVAHSRLAGIAIYSTPAEPTEFSKSGSKPSLAAPPAVGLLSRALLLPCSFILFRYAEMSHLRKAGRVEGKSVAAVLFGAMQAARFRQMDQRRVSPAGTKNKSGGNAGAAFVGRSRR